MSFRTIVRAIALTAFVTGIASAQGGATPPKTTTKAPPTAPATTSKPAAAKLLDINTATKAELMALPAIGDKIADKIIAGRPFKGKDELVSKKILTEAAYAKVKDAIIAKQK